MVDDPYEFVELDELTRDFMLAELQADIDLNGSPYISKKTLTPRGREDYTELLRAAIANGDETVLVSALNQHERVVDAPIDAALRLGRTEFNRYYIRGICLRAHAHGTNSVTVYRAHGSEVARPSSTDLVDREQFAPRILANVRGSQGFDPETNVGRVNSGISVRCGCVSCMAVHT